MQVNGMWTRRRWDTTVSGPIGMQGPASAAREKEQNRQQSMQTSIGAIIIQQTGDAYHPHQHRSTSSCPLIHLHAPRRSMNRGFEVVASATQNSRRALGALTERTHTS
eukprot:3115640-Rhodomonas_salina.5